MRKVTKEIVTAFLKKESKRSSNTSTDGDSIILHGNIIAFRRGNSIIATLSGYPTVTTRERLNGLCKSLGI